MKTIGADKGASADPGLRDLVKLRKDNEMSLTDTSRFISLILRHKPETIGITLDEHGWANVNELIEGIPDT